jgi:hypothetical protein
MTNLEQLKQDLANLTERVNCAMTLTDGSIYLTREQLKKIINTIQKQTIEYIKEEIEDIRLDGEDYVELELNYNREIEVTFDNNTFRKDIERNINGVDGIGDSELDDLLYDIKLETALNVVTES